MDPTIPTGDELTSVATSAPRADLTSAPDASAAALACPNCGTVAGPRTRYCVGCGQRRGESLLTVRTLLADLLEDVFALDGRLPNTLRGLFFRPGHLTREYAAGRIARYVRPFKLYLASSVIFFLALSISFKLDIPPEVTRDTAAVAGGLGAVSEPRERQQWPFFERILESFIEKASGDPNEAARRLIDRMLDDAPKAVFVLLPIFALFLKILYLRRRRLYVEHLVFVLHVHAFGFLLAAPLLLVPDSWPTGLLWLALPVYLLWAMKRVYGQSWARTIFKFFTFGWAYLFSVVITLVTVTIVAALAVGSATF